MDVYAGCGHYLDSWTFAGEETKTYETKDCAEPERDELTGRLNPKWVKDPLRLMCVCMHHFRTVPSGIVARGRSL